MNDKPYKIVWSKVYEINGNHPQEHVHYEQYTELDNAQNRMDELTNVHKVRARLYEPGKWPMRKY